MSDDVVTALRSSCQTIQLPNRSGRHWSFAAAAASGAPDAAAAAKDQWRPDLFGSWIVWQDERNAVTTSSDIYGFRFTPASLPINLLLSRETGMGSLVEVDPDSWPSVTEQWATWATGDIGEEPTSVRALDLSK